MDISVSRLNNRMSLQVPSELPLGLVFITGRVGALAQLGNHTEPMVAFELRDEQHRLPCRVPQRVIEETQVESGDRIRVSGHLLFDARAVQYYLLARDLEVLPAAPAPSAPEPAVMTPAVKKRARAASLVPGELPPWVKQLAPREVQAELGLLPAPAASAKKEEKPIAVPPIPDSVEEKANELTPEMLAFLSSAIDSDEDIELTPDMIQDYLPPEAREEQAAQAGGKERSAGSPAIVPPTIGEEVYEESVAAGSPRKLPPKEKPPLAQHPLSAGDESSPAPSESNDGERWVLLLAFILVLLFLLFLTVLLWDRLGIGILLAHAV